MPHSEPLNTATSCIEVVPLPALERLNTLLGAEVKLAPGGDLDHLSSDDEKKLVDALHEHSVLVVRRAGIKHPSTMTALCRIFDKDALDMHSYGKTAVREKTNVLSRNNAGRLKGDPNVVVIGNGFYENYDGGEDLQLRHVTQAEFHAKPLTEAELADGQTRFYRWHLDAPLYERYPGKVTIISCQETPGYLPDQKIVFEDGSVKSVYPGGTAYVSGARAFSLLTPEEKEWAMNTRVQYAPRAYNWIGDCKATSDGLTIESEGKERDFDSMEPWTWDKAHCYPLVFRNPGKPSRPHLIALGCCVYSLITTDPRTGKETTISDFGEARKKIHSLMKRSMSDRYVYVHRYEPDDLVIWHNRAVWHSITGELGNSKRLMWQAANGSPYAPQAAQWDEVDIEGKTWAMDMCVGV
ncbi:sulfonate dioxygenase [Grosmannia clavigera kw1407]|uniref:Sulfonate dioxygenase n=1 Tax=Grosmannia clavigera (strain kw1407 / UAMH 11150) TaxID=655863 RepID=F0X9W5_GROCL|nr:sulfonate dioxygenase [Grosmannia clavigera kw1407]EFX05492.1 sulfonate dioxygenase [Grosmannia clavigera kw1407]